jgi:hypothetical protein
MRKLILIAAIATLSSSACYANLSLASNDAPQQAIAQPSAQALDARAEAKAEAKAEAAVTSVRPANISRPKPRHQSGRTFVIRNSYAGCQ